MQVRNQLQTFQPQVGNHVWMNKPKPYQPGQVADQGCVDQPKSCPQEQVAVDRSTKTLPARSR